MKAFLYTLREIFEIVLIAIIVVVGVRQFLVQPFLVSGSSMEPNFHSGDYILINEVSFRFRQPERGEVVVFKYPGNEKTYFIKRIIGLPGERMSVLDGKVYIYNTQNPKGFLVSESYLPKDLKTIGNKELQLANEEYFVMGDNRNASFDSRQWGSLQKTEIIGIVWLRLWPLNQVMAFEKPSY
ncbi:signal peptidase I [Candidatus Wolfebacteria bacterium CG10_big_fil_rev_8_21_14_0_10_31_9]|uniref:Signal peptidase I n=1 Tax=Candidatus Wolfebacteria bacterium CG10_big_fil_rev_8_21_14_0_10_31_9 TaxID=1975070 RepID=A0A2H0RCL4_9BACT|nr:MAG: signal peptidase I [Candidatus Wolfebacteria bacterium CG10_big_fil_rev_8_21_14_0_10_31_9]